LSEQEQEKQGQEQEKEKETKREEKQEETRTERREETREPERREDEPSKLCPNCYTRVPVEHYGSHQYHAHGVERRQSKERKDDQENGDQSSPTPKRKAQTGSSSDDKAPQSGAKRKSRWSEVRSGWGG
jgi:hypothetical protein